MQVRSRFINLVELHVVNMKENEASIATIIMQTSTIAIHPTGKLSCCELDESKPAQMQ